MEKFKMRKTGIVIIAVIAVMVMGIISIILQEAVYKNKSNEMQNLNLKYFLMNKH